MIELVSLPCDLVITLFWVKHMPDVSRGALSLLPLAHYLLSAVFLNRTAACLAGLLVSGYCYNKSCIKIVTGLLLPSKSHWLSN